ncbi:DUF3987 domain-containing protein [Methylobacterium sp. 13MFTsu3.1M2]|uniref:DUF3987 domain-containing protein n=1 Tax=Methylobacterium sp. 13MFTsu3.1M2 TaxID=1502776 RepID=UPI0008EDBBBC|nr:DUF3987 domain-containing protein [Methylobacterium sp. 13MFTsu3.1M2]SFD69334.1 Protein of unknown function [Methylobacterium sp. 13MFTsu3.1M2]
MDATTPEGGSGDRPTITTGAFVPTVDASALAPNLSLPRWDTEVAVDFIIALIGSGLIAVAAIDPETGGCHGATFALPSQRDALSQWLEARQGRYNLYYTLNEPVPPEQQQGKNGRVCKADIVRIRGVAIDCDPVFNPNADDGGLTEERLRLFAQAVEWRKRDAVSAAIDSGGGYQGVWLLREPLPATPEVVLAVEAQARGLAHLNDGDNTHDVSHLFRLPGTINLPNAKKLARKRVPALVQGKVFDDPRRLHTLKDLAILAPPILTREAAEARRDFDLSAAWEALGDPEKLDPGLIARLTAARAVRPYFDRCLAEENTVQSDRSKRDFAVAAAVIRAGFLVPPEIAAIVAAYSPEKFQAEAEARGDGRAEYYLRRTVANALAQVKPDTQSLGRTKPDAQPSDFFEMIEDSATEPTEAIEDPVDLFGDDDPADLSTPPSGSLPDVIEMYARTEADRIGVPMMFAAAAAVTVAGGALGNALQIQPRRHDPTYTEPAALWTVLVGPPGCAKSPTISSALTPLRAVDKQLMEVSEHEHRAYEARKAASKKDKTTPIGPPPLWRRTMIDDVTPEQQIRLHQQNPRGLMRAVDEYVSFLNFGAYKRNGDGDRGRALQFFDGGSIILDRVSEAKPIRADSALMGLLSSSQPDRIGPLFRNLGVDGLGQRTLFVLWDGVERRFVDRAPDLGALAEYASAIQALAAIDKMSGGTVRLSDAAHVVMDRVDALIRRQAHLPGASAAWEGHISKWGKLLPRITLIFHALETWSLAGRVPVDAEVTANTMRKAGRFALFLLKHAWHFYRVNSEPQERTTAARWIAGWILAHPEKERFTPRDIERAYRELRKDRPAIVAAMRDLEEAAWIEVSRPASPGSNGPGEWRVNPDVHRRFAERAVREKAERTAKRAKIEAAVQAQRSLPDDV